MQRRFASVSFAVAGLTEPYQFVGFWLAFLLPTLVFLMAPVVLWIGRNRYVRSPPAGSVFSKALRILRYCAKGRMSLNPVKTWRNLTAPDFWDAAKPSRVQETEGGKPSWMTFDDQWVDEVRRGFKACIVFLWMPIYCACAVARMPVELVSLTVLQG